jgi:ribonuclease HI
MAKIYINTDGGSRGNPGPAAIGVAFFDEQESMTYSYMKYIGSATNNEAEYQAIIAALKILSRSEWLKKHNNSDNEVVCRLDSQLVVEQVNGNYRIKQDHIKRFIEEIRNLISGYCLKITFVHVRREQNKHADKLVNQALNEVKNNHRM